MKPNTIVDATERLQKYVRTYDNQVGYEKYRLETYLNDILYGLGASISDDFQFAPGFEKFKDFLVKFIVTGEVPEEFEEYIASLGVKE